MEGKVIKLLQIILFAIAIAFILSSVYFCFTDKVILSRNYAMVSCAVVFLDLVSILAFKD